MSSRVDTTAGHADVHPPEAEAACDAHTGCITCGDVAEEMRVVRIDAERELALCEHATGERQTVEIALVQPVAEADTLLVHAGTALANLGHEGERDPIGADAGADQDVRGVAAGQMFQAGAQQPMGSGPDRNTPGRTPASPGSPVAGASWEEVLR